MAICPSPSRMTSSRRFGVRSQVTNRIALGTVQFGQHYGISNRTGQVAQGEAAVIVGHAWDAGIDTLDTAIAYGDSERCLGRVGVAGWRVVSKLPPVPDKCPDLAGWVAASVGGTLRRLGLP